MENQVPMRKQSSVNRLNDALIFGTFVATGS